MQRTRRLDAMQVFTGGLSSFTVFNMVCGMLQHQCITQDGRTFYLPPLHKLPKVPKYRSLEPHEMPPQVCDLRHLDDSMRQRISYSALHAAAASWHFSTDTLLERHAASLQASAAPSSTLSGGTPGAPVTALPSSRAAA
jgi:hypothetical protein